MLIVRLATAKYKTKPDPKVWDRAGRTSASPRRTTPDTARRYRGLTDELVTTEHNLMWAAHMLVDQSDR